MSTLLKASQIAESLTALAAPNLVDIACSASALLGTSITGTIVRVYRRTRLIGHGVRSVGHNDEIHPRIRTEDHLGACKATSIGCKCPMRRA